MAFSQLQVVQNQSNTTTCINTVASTGNGNLLVVSIGIFNNAHSDVAVTGVADNAGNIYTQVPGATIVVLEAGYYTVSDIWYKSGATGGATSVTATSNYASTQLNVCVREFSGGSAFVDAVATYAGTGSHQAATVTTTDARDVLVSTGSDPSSIHSSGAGWIQDAISVGNGTIYLYYIPGSVGTFPYNLSGPDWTSSTVAFSPPPPLTLTLTDSISSSDLTVKEDEKIITDSVTSSDSLALARGQTVSDSITVTDSFSLQSSFIAPVQAPVVENLVGQLTPAEVKLYFDIQE